MTKRKELDVRSVEPKDRFEVIMDAYDGLGAGDVLDLTVDHDPRCMYHTLKATRDDGFTFDYLESGPETWRVHVGKPRTKAGDADGPLDRALEMTFPASDPIALGRSDPSERMGDR